MLATVRDLLRHQAWADAEMWRALSAHPSALEDVAVKTRLLHTWQAHAFFVALAEGGTFDGQRLMAERDLPALRSEVMKTSAEAEALLAALDEERLAAPLVLPWFPEPAGPMTIGEGLVQAAMHSHYHRAQNATRLKELGGTPPLTDLIIWIARGRPTPRWE